MNAMLTDEELTRLLEEAAGSFAVPEPEAYWGTGDSATRAYADVIEMVEVRNAVQLEEFVQRLLPV